MEFISLLFLKTKEKGNKLLHLGPRISVSSRGRSLAELDRTGEGRAAVFRREEAPEVGARLGKMERSSSFTCRWSRWGLGWPVAGWPRAPAAGGGPVPRLRHSGEGEAAWLGLGAPLGRGEAVPGVDWSCGRAEVGAGRGAGGRRWSEPRRRRSSGLGRWWRGWGAPMS